MLDQTKKQTKIELVNKNLIFIKIKLKVVNNCSVKGRACR